MAGYPNPEPDSGGLGRQLWSAAIFLVLGGVLFTFPAGLQEQFAGVLRGSVLAPFIALNGAVNDAEIRAVRAEELRASTDSLTLELQARTTLEEENRRLRDVLLLAERLPADWIAAEAIRPPVQGMEGIFLLDVGSDDGIRARAPVVTREGLAGVIRGEGRPSGALGMDWSHPDFAASAMSEDGLTYGIVESRRGAFRELDRLVLVSTPFNTVLDSGTVILTSGRGGTFPRGIPIGRIEGELLDEPVPGDGERAVGFERSYWVTPFVDPGEMTLVLVQRSRADGVGAPPATLGPDTAAAGSDSIPDLSSAWPASERMRAEERARLVPVWRDSLRLLRDSIASLVGTPPDSAGGGR